MKKLIALILAALLTAGTPLTFVLAEGPLPVQQMEQGDLAPTQAEDEAIPPQIQKMILIAQEELLRHGGKTLKKSNDYTVSYYGDKTAIGWCAAFTTWCAIQADMTMLKEAQVKAFVDGDVSKLAYEPLSQIPDVFMMNEVNVIRCRNTYMLTARLVDIPKPGYQIFYGRIGGAPTLHTGLVESVRLIREGVYEITTLEGNVANRVKRFCSRYTINPKRRHYNFTPVPAKERIVENAQYKLHSEDWHITGFGKTW